MAVGKLAKSVMGLADEFMEGAAKGIGDAGTIKASVNKMKSNMTKGQIKKLKAFGKSKSNAGQAIAKSTQKLHQTSTIKNAVVRPNANFRKGLASVGDTVREKGIQNATLMNKVGDAVAGGFKDTYTGLKSGRGLTRSLSDAYMDGDKLRGGRVVGSFMAASAAGRIATGGGLYKDRNGSTNIIGVPFI